MKNLTKKISSLLLLLGALLSAASCAEVTTTGEKPVDPTEEKISESYIVNGEIYTKEEFAAVDLSGLFLSECRIKVEFSLTSADMKNAAESAKRHLDNLRAGQKDESDEELQAKAKELGYADVGEQIFKKELDELFSSVLPEGVFLSYSGDFREENGVYYPCAVCTFARNAEESSEEFDPFKDPAFDACRACVSALKTSGKLRSGRISAVEYVEEYRDYIQDEDNTAG